ncbi:unnamed protein product [Closterium sp. NIES-53]
MVIVLEKELAALSMQPGDDVKPVLDKIKDTYAKMAAAGSNVSQMQQCTKIISVLDNSWDNLIPTLNTQQDHWTPGAWELCRPEGWAHPGMKPPNGERAQGAAVQGSSAQGDGAQGKANPGMFLMVEDVKGSEGDVGSIGKVVMHPLTHWVIDSGCTSHMTPRANLLDEVKPPGKIKFVAAASGALLPVIGVGNAKRVPLPSPPASSLPAGPDPTCDSLRAVSPAVTRVLATAVTDPLFESTTASALVFELVDFAAACRLDYATSLVAESASVCPPSVGGECALGTDVLEDRQKYFECFSAASPHLVSMLLASKGDPDALNIPTPRSYAEAIEGPYSSQWQAAMDAEMASWKSTSTYVDEVPPPGANIFSGMWIFRVKRPPGSPPAFKARYVARGFSQRQGVDFFQTFSPTPKMTTLRVLLHVASQRDYELHSLDFSTAFLQGSLHEEIWLRRPPRFTGSFPAGTQWSLRGPVYGLRQAPREWHDTLRTTLAALGFAPSTSNPSLFLRTDTTLPPFFVLVYVDDLVFATTDTEALAHVKSEQQKRHTCTDLGQPRVVLTGHADASWVDDLTTQRSSQGYTFSLGSGSVSWRSTRSSSVLSSSCEAEIYAGAMAAQELRGLTYLLTDLGEAPRSPPILCVDNKAILACLRLAYVASQANTADVFTKALQPCDHQRFCTVLGLVPTVPHLLSS